MVQRKQATGLLVSSEVEHRSQQAGIVGESDKPLDTINYHACGLDVGAKAEAVTLTSTVRSRDGGA